MFRLLIRTLAVASCVVLTVAACSKKVDSSSVEKDVVRVVKANLPAVSKVTAECPGDVEAKKGQRFQCDLTLDGKATEVKINITDVKNKQFFFKPQYTEAIIDTSAYATALAKRVGSGSKAVCGKEKVVLKNPGDIITCTVTVKGQTQQYKLRVKDTDGNLDLVK